MVYAVVRNNSIKYLETSATQWHHACDVRASSSDWEHFVSALIVSMFYPQVAGSGSDGVIVFSFGLTGFDPSVVPERFREGALKALAQLRQRVVLHFDPEQLRALPSNVIAMRKIPQQDLLGQCIRFLSWNFGNPETRLILRIFFIPEFLLIPRCSLH